MRKKTWLIIDAHYVCWRSHYSVGNLMHEGKFTGTKFGFFQELLQLRDQHQTDEFIFCFDGGGENVRMKKFPGYKIARRIKVQNATVEEAHIRREVLRQIKELRNEHLPDIGFNNIFFKEGYEADDCIGSLCRTLPRSDDIIIVSADHDLWQLLHEDRILFWNLHVGKIFTAACLKATYGVTPAQWALVKAIAGCKSDSVPGVCGVLEKTAAKFLAGTLPKKSKRYAAIVAEEDEWRKTLPLVKLPYPGTPIFKPKDNAVTSKKWREVLTKLGIDVLIKHT